MKKFLTGILLLCLCVINLPAGHAEELAQVPAVTAQAYIVVEASTGRVLAEKDADAQHYPASMTKMMTAILSLEHLSPDDTIAIGQDAATTEDSALNFAAGDVFQRDQLVGGMLLVSDNGAAVALADRLGGGIPQFADMMNDKASELGMTNTHFANPNGLTNPQHYSTARDMMKLARYAMENPTFRHMVGTKKAQVHWLQPANKVIMAENTNELLGVYPGMKGIKTGWTMASGGCLAAEAKQNGVDLLVVLMQTPTMEDRFTDAKALLDYGFANVQLVKGATAADTTQTVWVTHGKKARTQVKAVNDINYPLLNGEDASHYTLSYEVPKVIDAAQTAEGEVVGKAIVKYDGEPVGSVDMVAEPVEQGFSVGSCLVNLFSGILKHI